MIVRPSYFRSHYRRHRDMIPGYIHHLDSDLGIGHTPENNLNK